MCNYSGALLQRGINQGEIRGENNMTQLYKALSSAGRKDDYEKSVDDILFREKLYYEFGIKKKADQSAQ